jgi:uncharacterized protein (TIGR00369 family)
MTTTLTTPARPVGRTILEMVAKGHFPPPPAASLLGLDLLEVGDGLTRFGFTPDQRFNNGQGGVHGGILATVADFALSTAVVTVAPPNATVVTTNLSVAYLRPVRTDDPPVTAVGRVVHRGNTLVYAEAVLTDGDGRELVRASATCRLSIPAGTDQWSHHA